MDALRTSKGAAEVRTWLGAVCMCAIALAATVALACASSGAGGQENRRAELVAAIDFQGRPASTLVDWLGEPDKIRRVAPSILLYEWYHRGRLDPGYPDPGLETKAGFFVRPDGTVIGPACAIDSVPMTNVDEIVAVLGPPTRLRRYRLGNAEYSWRPQKPEHGRTAQPRTCVVEMRLTLAVDKYGYIRAWN
jgi:hypothetical protein